MSDGRKTATATESANWSCPRERQAARAMILAAARTMAERDGVEAVTLSAVARETKIARAAIYSHFSSRQDLISALSQDEAEIPAETAPQEVVAEAPTADSNLAEAREEGASPEGPQNDEYDALMRAQAEALQQLTSQVIVPKAKHRDAAEAALTRMETRVTVAEQSLAALDQRVSERLKGLDAETGSLADTLQGLRSRVEKFEERQQAALAELRLDIHNLKTTEDVVTVDVPSESIPDPLPTEALQEPPVEIAIDEALPADTEPSRVPGYLSTARQAAIKAATPAVPPHRHRAKSPLVRTLIRKRWTLIAIAAVVVAWFDFYVFAHYEPAQGGIAPTATVTAPSTRVPAVLSPQAQLARGLKYLNGTGVPVNVDRARKWLERAASHGHPVAQNLMGVLYQTGTGVAADMPTAIRWYAASATHGNLKAMTNLGKLYAGGWSQGTDFAKAAGWFAKAAAYGDVDAQFDLAILYERGEGVPPSSASAYKWYSIAARNGDNHAADRAAMLAAQLSMEELQAADEAVIAFRPLPIDQAANGIPKG